MKTMYGGTNEFPFVKTDTIRYSWKFEEAEDHEHPYVLTVTVAGDTHSEGCGNILDEDEASVKAEELAREFYAISQSRP